MILLRLLAGIVAAFITLITLISIFLFICIVFIGIALIVASPFILIIGLVLWIFF